MLQEGQSHAMGPSKRVRVYFRIVLTSETLHQLCTVSTSESSATPTATTGSSSGTTSSSTTQQPTSSSAPGGGTCLAIGKT